MAEQVRAIELERVEQGAHPAGEEACIVGGGKRLVGIAEARQVDRDRAEARRERGHRRQELLLRRAEAVDQDDRLAHARLEG